MPAKIEIYGPTSVLSGDYPYAEVREATSWAVEGARYSKAYKKGLWDGRKHLFNTKTGSFPTGLLSIVTEVLANTGVVPEIVDLREDPASVGTLSPDSFSLEGVSFTGKYDYQLDACMKMVAAKQGIVRAATNAGKSEIACGVTKVLDIKTLFVVQSVELLHQARDRFAKRLGMACEDVGIIGDGHWVEGDLITIATLGTLESRMDTPEAQRFLKSVELLFLDEAHHAGSETWYTIATLCPAFYRFGLSGTPLDRTDGANLRLIAVTGDVIVDISNKFLVDRGVSARAHIVFDKITSPSLKKGIKYNTAYKQGVVENEQLTEKVIAWTKAGFNAGLSVLILVDELQHGRSYDEKLWTDTGDVFIPHQFICGEETTEVRSNALKEFGERTLPVLIASTILDEGVDVPTIDMIITAGARKSKIRTLQRLGRGLRGEKLIVVEFANFCHQYLLEHSLKRYKDYQAEECFPMYNSVPDEALIRKLWQ